MSYILVKETEKGVCMATIQNPPMNTLNAEVMKALAAFINELKDSRTKALIITGAGEKAFVAGAEVSEFFKLDEGTGTELALKGQAIFNQLSRLPFPVICAINGYALGAGLELALACDIRIAEEQVKVGLPEVNLGIIPGYGGTQRLSRLIGVGKAKELVFSGEYIGSDEALRLGVIERIVPKGESLHAAQEFAETLIEKSPLAIVNAKRVISEGIELSLSEGQKLEGQLFGQLSATADAKEGAAAFLEKRKPHFRGE